MTYEKLKKRVVGPCTSLITPMKKDFSLDEEGLRANIRYVIDNGFKEGIGCMLAATPGGESPSMSIPMRKQAMKVIVDEVNGALPLETAAHDNSYEAVIDMMKYAKDLGFDIIQLQAPWYHGTSPDEVYRFYDGVTHAVDIPVMFYNATWLGILGGVGLEMPLVERLSKLDGVIGIKWSSPNWHTYIDVLRHWTDRFVFSDNNFHGLGCLFGSQSFLDVIGQFHPKYPLELWKYIQAHDWDKAYDHLWKLEIPYYLWIGEMQKQGIHGEGPLVKAPMRLAGRPAGPAIPPYEVKYTEKQLAPLQEILYKGGVPGVKAPK